MASLHILHAADLHLGGPVAAPDPALEGLAADARAQGLERLVELSHQRGVGLVLLAGDVFHAPDPPLGARLALEKALAAWREMGARVFIAPGNHDPWLPGGVWPTWPQGEGLTIFSPQPQGVDLPEHGLWVAGAAHAAADESRDLSQALPPPPEGSHGLAVLHANLASAQAAQAHEPYAPAHLPSLKAGPFSLWALGHIHMAQELSPHPRVLYAGTPQGAHLGETGPKGAWLISWQDGASQAEFAPLAPLEFYDLSLADLEQAATPGALVDRVRSALPASSGPWSARRCARLTLAGPSPLWQALRQEGPQALEAILRQELGLDGLVLRLEGLHPPLDLAALAGRDDVLGRALTLAKQAQDDPAFLAKLAEELAPELHPETRPAGPKQRQARLRELLEPAAWLLAGGLRPNGPEGGDAA